MRILARIKNALVPKPYPAVEFGMENMRFFIALLHACPPGSRIIFDQSEPESFVHAFRKWSHRENEKQFEADFYTIDHAFIRSVEEHAKRGGLKLYCHFGISSSQGDLLCTSWDDFAIVKLADGLVEKIRETAKAH